MLIYLISSTKIILLQRSFFCLFFTFLLVSYSFGAKYLFWHENFTSCSETLIQNILTNNIKIVGFLDNAFSLIPQFDLYFMSSEWEGLPITIYESFFQKTVVISTRAGGIPEAIKHDDNGLLSDIKDYEGLAKNISRLIKNSELKETFVKKSYALVLNKFTTKQLAVNTLSVYKDVLRTK